MQLKKNHFYLLATGLIIIVGANLVIGANPWVAADHSVWHDAAGVQVTLDGAEYDVESVLADHQGLLDYPVIKVFRKAGNDFCGSIKEIHCNETGAPIDYVAIGCSIAKIHNETEEDVVSCDYVSSVSVHARCIFYWDKSGGCTSTVYYSCTCARPGLVETILP